jgi:hypothetical protein
VSFLALSGIREYTKFNSNFQGKIKMGFDKPYPNRKDKRAPFHGAKAIDAQCRNHGTCPWCKGNRTYKNRKRIERAKQLQEDAHETN